MATVEDLLQGCEDSVCLRCALHGGYAHMQCTALQPVSGIGAGWWYYQNMAKLLRV